MERPSTAMMDMLHTPAFSWLWREAIFVHLSSPDALCRAMQSARAPAWDHGYDMLTAQ